MNTTHAARDEGALHVGLAAALVVAAAVAFAGAVVWAGGVEGVMDLVLGNGSQEEQAAPVDMSQVPPRPEVPGESEEPTGSGTEPLALGDAVPQDARDAMYREQLQSQARINELVSGEVALVAFGAAETTAGVARIPIEVTYADGGEIPGTMTLAESGGLWLFMSLSGQDGAPVDDTTPVDSKVVDTLVSQQALAANQTLIKTGLIDGGFERARVERVTQGSGTATIELTLLGGSLDNRPARFVCIADDEDGETRWFLTRFELE